MQGKHTEPSLSREFPYVKTTDDFGYALLKIILKCQYVVQRNGGNNAACALFGFRQRKSRRDKKNKQRN